jgi:hypothetical protein
MVLRELDRLENEARPTLETSNDHLSFDKIAYLEPQTHSINLKNTGLVCPPNRASSKPLGNDTL